jgi:hypothetical protein
VDFIRPWQQNRYGFNAIDAFVGDFSISDLERACPSVGRDWIRKLLQKLKHEGKVYVSGKGRFAKWQKVQ